MQLRSYASIIRAVTIATRIEVVDHWRKELIGQIRTVIKTQKNGYWYVVPGEKKRLWGDYAKPKELSFPAPNMFRADCADTAQSMTGRFFVMRILEGLGELPPPSPLIRRTFEARKHPEGSAERARLNLRSETSEYYPSRRYMIRTGDLSCLFRSRFAAAQHLKKQEEADAIS